MLPKIIFFDLDDTLVDHRSASSSAMDRIRHMNDILGSVSLERLEELWSLDFRKYWELLINGGMSLDENRRLRFRNIFRTLGENVSDEVVDEVLDAYSREYISNSVPIPGALELLEKVREKGVETGIITNNIIDVQMEKIRRCGLSDLLDHMIISQQYRIMKPDPEIFRIALESSGHRASESVMLGDSLNDDVLGARNAGIKPIWFNRGGKRQSPEDQAISMITSLEPADDVWNFIMSAYS